MEIIKIDLLELEKRLAVVTDIVGELRKQNNEEDAPMLASLEGLESGLSEIVKALEIHTQIRLVCLE